MYKKEEQEEEGEKPKKNKNKKVKNIYICRSLIRETSKQRFVWDNDRCDVVQTSFLQIIFISKIDKCVYIYQTNEINSLC